MPGARPKFDKCVFLNCPFDKEYKPLLNVAVFTLVYCGFQPRIASETSDSLQVRIEKIKSLIKGSMYSIHDLCRMEAQKAGELARFNMPFELGMDFGCRVYGGKGSSNKKCIIFDKKRYRYAKALSDLAGVDIEIHKENPELLVRKLRHWIRDTLHVNVASASEIWRNYILFFGDFIQTLKDLGFKKKDIDEMGPNEYMDFIYDWQKRQL